jgi:hypothetical protein
LISFGYASEREIRGLGVSTVLTRVRQINEYEKAKNKQQPQCPLMGNGKKARSKKR